MKSLLVGAFASLLLSVPVPAADNDAHYRNNGYGLLYKLCEQERPLDMILIVKTAPPDVAGFLHEVARTAKDDVNLLDDLHDHNKSIRFDDPGLPQFEEDTRGSIRDDKQHMLLFGTTDKAFARALLITQIEAGTYGMNLAKVLADAEPNAHRADVVRKISARWEKIRDKAYRLLNAL